jgi:hypothetical protein
LQLAGISWTIVSTDYIADPEELEGERMILAVVDRFTKMTHDIPLQEEDSPIVAWAYLENIW